MTAYGDDLRAKSRADGQRNIEREVERLRAANRDLIEERDAAVDRQTVVDAEVERLRAELDNCKGGGAYRDEVGSLTSENERLRAAVQAVRELPVHYASLVTPGAVGLTTYAAVTMTHAVVRKAVLDAALDGERDE